MRAVGASRSQLYRAFEPVGGVATAIQEERLKAAWRALSKDAGTRSVREIAETVGMFDPSSFSRTFRRTFGMTPTEWRSMHNDASKSTNAHAGEGFSLEALLRR